MANILLHTMFSSRIFRVVSDILLVVLSASVGGFAWRHISDIYNSGKILETIMTELSQYTLAYVLVFARLAFIGTLLWLRYKYSGDTITKEVPNITT